MKYIINILLLLGLSQFVYAGYGHDQLKSLISQSKESIDYVNVISEALNQHSDKIPENCLEINKPVGYCNIYTNQTLSFTVSDTMSSVMGVPSGEILKEYFSSVQIKYLGTESPYDKTIKYVIPPNSISPYTATTYISWDNLGTTKYVLYEDPEDKASTLITGINTDKQKLVTSGIFIGSNATYTYNIIIEELNPAINQIQVRLSSTIESSEQNVFFNMTAKADNDGGYLISEFETDAAGFYMHRESFDGKGNTLGLEQSINGINWENIGGRAEAGKYFIDDSAFMSNVYGVTTTNSIALNSGELNQKAYYFALVTEGDTIASDYSNVVGFGSATDLDTDGTYDLYVDYFADTSILPVDVNSCNAGDGHDYYLIDDTGDISNVQILNICLYQK